MTSRRIKQLLSFLFIALGAFLLFIGARDLWESHFGQREAARQFQRIVTQPPVRPPGSARPFYPPVRDGDTLARIIFPRLDRELYVVQGDTDADLRRAPGHLIGTAMPGAMGNCVIAGHRDLHFRLLKDIRKDDEIVLRTRTGEYLYRVKNVTIVSPANVSSLQPTSDAELHLITCYPFYYLGHAPKRFVVTADLAAAVSNLPRTVQASFEP